ncbi:Polysaccharide deacetylase-like protein, partial [Leptotrombidium deliense]
PKPTNKRLIVKHTQRPRGKASRPVNVYETPAPFSKATKCNNDVCIIPDCKCGNSLIPGNLPVDEIPQIILLTFDDAVNDLNWDIYEELFSTGRKNPNGCPLVATYYVSHEWTDYGQVQTLYSRGHEMASHGITFGEKFSKNQWLKEINGQREILHLYGGVKFEDVRGMRAPFLQIGGNKMFEMLYDANFTYDSSMPVFDNKPPFWPYTLDYNINHECMISPCPTKSFPGIWEVGEYIACVNYCL